MRAEVIKLFVLLRTIKVKMHDIFLHFSANFSQRMILNANSTASHLELYENDN